MENLNAEQIISKLMENDSCYAEDIKAIRNAISLIKSQEQRIKELTEEKKKSDRVFSDLYKEAETYLAQRECLRNQVKNLTEDNERLMREKNSFRVRCINRKESSQSRHRAEDAGEVESLD